MGELAHNRLSSKHNVIVFRRPQEKTSDEDLLDFNKHMKYDSVAELLAYSKLYFFCNEGCIVIHLEAKIR